MARPIGGSHSHMPSQEADRKIPIAVAIVASGGQRRSQKLVHRARLSARSRTPPASGRRDALVTLLASVTRRLLRLRSLAKLAAILTQNNANKKKYSTATSKVPANYRRARNTIAQPTRKVVAKRMVTGCPNPVCDRG